MDEKKLRSNVKSLEEISKKTSSNLIASKAVSDEDSFLNLYVKKNNSYLSPLRSADNASFRLMAALMQSKEEDYEKFKKALMKFINLNSNKLGLFLAKYTQFEDLEDFLRTKSTEMNKVLIELVLFCQLYQLNLKVIYYDCDKIKEK